LHAASEILKERRVSLASNPADLLSLAHSRDPDDRERLLNGMVEMCAQADAAQTALTPQVNALVEGLFITLVQQAEHDIRRRLAERLADAAWAPSTLVNMLALDEIEISQPIITYSPVLAETDLIRILVEATLDHQLAVARRPGLTAGVVDAILQAGEPAVLTALSGNETAEIGAPALVSMVEHARRIVAMRSPLARHPRLSSELAVRLYAWVGESLKTALTSRFRLDPVALDAAIAEATRAAAGSSPAAPVEEERDDMDRGLVEKLKGAGQLRAGYLLRALREGRLNLFIHILAGLGGFDTGQLRRAIDSDRPELLALACAGVGVDRGAYPTILELVRDLNGQRPGGGAESARRAGGAFGPFDADIARAAFNQAAARA
jgi:uncharacterized protein (DUF2336 family)